MEEFTQGVGKHGLGSKGTTNVLREYEGCPQPHKDTPGAHRLIHGEREGAGASTKRYGENLTDNRAGSKTLGGAYGENLPASAGHGAYETTRNDASIGGNATRTTDQVRFRPKERT